MGRVLAAFLLIAGTFLPASASTSVDLRVQGAEGNIDAPFTMTLDLAVPEPEAVELNGLVYSLFSLEGEGWLGEPGRPDLPAVHRLINLPDRSDVQVRVTGGTSYLLDGILPLPVQEQLHNQAEEPQPWLQDMDLYNTDAWYPAEIVALDAPALVRNHRVAKCSLFPVQVNPVTGQARVWTSLQLQVTFDGTNPVNPRVWELPAAATRLEGVLSAALVNPRHADHGLEDVWGDPGDLPGTYLVFASASALTNARLQDLLDWKRQRGHRIVIESTPSILNSPVSIRTRITTEYNSADPVKFVMLVGDTDGSFPIASDGTGYDHYYTCIEGNDILGDVAVGRLSVDNTTQLTTVCNKILSYEKDPYLSDTAWLRHAGVLVGSTVCALSMKNVSRNIAAELVQSRGYNDIDTLWCSGSSPVIGLLGSGISFYNYRGYIGMEGLDGNAVEAMTQGPRTPVATIFTCSTGDFTFEDDYTERFFRGGNPTTPGAAVACMGYATSSTHTRYNNVMAVGFYHAFLEGDVPEVGSCLVESKYELYMTLPPGDGQAENFANWGNLMGDPGMRMWAGLPRELAFAVPSIRLNQGFLELDVTQDGAGAPGVIVSVWQENGSSDFQATTLTDADGHAWLDLQGIAAGDIVLTVSHHRARTQQHVITVSQPSVDPALASVSVAGGSAVPGQANQALQFTVRNDGDVTLTGLNLNLELDPAYGSVSSAVLTTGPLAPGATSAAITGATLSPAANLLDGDVLPVVIHVAATEGSADLVARVAAAGPSLLPTSQTTPGGVWLPASNRSLQVVLHNSGSVAATAPAVTLVSDAEDFVNVTSGTQTGTTIPAGGNGTFLFNVSITQDALVGMSLPLHLDMASNGTSLQRVDLLVPVGNPGSADPSGPDAWGYWAYEDGDNTYSQAPEFEWEGIAPAEGGPGVLVPLSDEGDEQDDIVRMDLPFGFTFYGETYDQVYISSNGFISFADMGVFYETDFRNHYLPSGQGPDAMIAPMWDDHLTTGQGNVYTWFDAATHRFVVEWYLLPGNQEGGPNTFQVILYDPGFYPTGTGDGEFKFQYQAWNDTQNSWTDFPYCTVGIKDHTSLRGMTLKNYNQLAPTMHPIGAGTAVLFTTTVSGVLTPPMLDVDPAGLTVDLLRGEATTAGFDIGNNGQVTLLYDLWLTFDARDSGGPDSYGYEWLDSSEELGPVYDWVSPANAVPVTFVHNDSTAGWFDIGFDFYLYGQPRDRFRISPNGFLSFTSHSGAWSNQVLPSDIAPLNSVFAWWDDLRPADNTPGYASYYTNNLDSLVVTWTAVPHYNPGANGGPFTMQAILRSNGEITLQYQNVGGGHSGSAGLQGGSITEGIGVFCNSPVPEPYAVRITPPAWAVLGHEEGVVVGGGTATVPVTFNSAAGYELPAGEYHATLHITTNDPDHQSTTVPLVMNVTGVDVPEAELPNTTRLAGNYPNPFNPSTRIRVDIARTAPVLLAVYNMLGQRVATLVDGPLPAGSHELDWNASHLPSGVYLLDLKADGIRDRSRLLLVK